jgi:hypothetical protein
VFDMRNRPEPSGNELSSKLGDCANDHGITDETETIPQRTPRARLCNVPLGQIEFSRPSEKVARSLDSFLGRPAPA